MKCQYDPTETKGEAIGMYHCPECGEMVLAGQPHPRYDIEPYFSDIWEEPKERTDAFGNEYTLDVIIAQRIMDMYEGKNGLPKCSLERIAMAVIGIAQQMDGQDLVRRAAWTLGKEW